jgi:hypothetical protein
MKRFIAAITIFSIVVFAVAVSGTAHAKKNKNRITRYKVTITNITRLQILSPPVVISHKGGFRLFTLGKPASDGLAALAEDADTTGLESELGGLYSVFDFAVGGGPIMPGASETIEIKTKSGFRRISAAAMLVTTNDAFMAVRGEYASSWESRVDHAAAYDAGSEFNSENCDFIPGPPCNNPGVRDTVNAEGYVYVHSGIHGSGDLDPGEWDWNNPVARIVIERVK